MNIFKVFSRASKKMEQERQEEFDRKMAKAFKYLDDYILLIEGLVPSPLLEHNEIDVHCARGRLRCAYRELAEFYFMNQK